MTKSKNKAAQFARCNQCKLVFKDGNDCGQHGVLTGHQFKPAYHCTVCGAVFERLKQRTEHVQTSGHVQQPPTQFASPSQTGKPAKKATATATATVKPTALVPTQTQVKKASASTSVSSAKSAPQQPCQQLAVPVAQGPFESASTSHTAADTKAPKPRCATCQVFLTSRAALQAHYNISSMHPSCRVCGLGFESSGLMSAHTPAQCAAAILAGAPNASTAVPVASSSSGASSSSTAPKAKAKAKRDDDHQTYFCETCYSMLDSPASITQHAEETGHSGFSVLKAEVPCPDCPQKFESVAGREKHRDEAHVRPSRRQPETPARASTSTPSLMNGTGTESTTGSSTPPKANGEPQHEAPKPAPASAPQPEDSDTNCAKCAIEFTSAEGLQAHFAQSALHPNCRACGSGFASIAAWATHRARCPPPGSTSSAGGAGAGLSGKGKEVAQDVEQQVVGDTSDASRSSSAVPSESEVSSMASTATPRSETPRSSQSASSPTPSTGVSTVAGGSNTLPSTDARQTHAETLPDQPQTDIHNGQSSTTVSDSEDGSLAASSTDRITRPPTVANSTVTSLGERTRGGSPVQTNAHRDWPRSDTPQDSRPVRKPANATPESSGVSFHCRSCLRDPCVEPVATVCGHLFCHRCIVQELSTKMCCPVCRKVFFVRLHVEVD